MKVTNQNNLPLDLAVWLMHDEYDHVDDPRYISATSLMKPIRQTILASRIPYEMREMDIASLISSTMGTAFHDSIERAWRTGAKKALQKLGYPAKIYENIAINPTDAFLQANLDAIPVYIEQRTIKEIDGWKVGGKFDMIIDGRLKDHKSTSVWAYIMGTKDEDYALQGGIYRWLNPDKIIDDHMFINFIFTDWQSSMVAQNPNYPKTKLLEYPVLMLDVDKVEAWIRQRLRDLTRLWNADEEDLPRCTDKELWMSDPKFKYYSDPAKANEPGARATKNFDNLAEANAFLSSKGKGVVKTVPGEPKACGYCPAFAVCSQKNEFFNV